MIGAKVGNRTSLSTRSEFGVRLGQILVIGLALGLKNGL